MGKRSQGTGTLLLRTSAKGAQSWYGQWRVNGRLRKRKLGARRTDTRPGLTRAAAERELRRLMADSESEPELEAVDMTEAGRRWVAHLALLGRKRSTLMDYESAVRVHLAPYFRDKELSQIRPRDIERFMEAKIAEGRSAKSVRNYLGVLNSLMNFAERREWCLRNPCRQIEFPRIPETDADIRYLDVEQLEALLRAVDLEHEWGPTEHAMYLTAAMTGLRQGELLALRWRDVDWMAGRIRVRRNFVRGEFGTPKSRRSSRSVPLADRVMKELDAHHRRSHRQSDDDLVFGHPALGVPFDRSRLLKRFKDATTRASLGHVRFHDLRHTFGTRMATAGVPMRTLQEWLGHRDFKTTLIYADYAPSAHERELVDLAFAPASVEARPLAAAASA